MQPLLSIVLGVTVLTVVGIAFGGTFMLRVVTGAHGANELQKTFFRAGHAHAGVLVTLGLTIGVLTHAAGADNVWGAAGTIAVLTAAIFVPIGFFLSVLGHDPQKPGRMVAAIWIGAALLTVGLIISGVAVVVAGVSAL
ncbi:MULTISPECIES: hypothetical protein [Antrihabitans]|uniref:Uncharacterized protein n=2 Tax=Antrihabitans TaxID=2799491 RepID=A0A934U3E3_9NOCA|nr:hypothetical protein [Antrihabitans stalagmiti]MBJ8339779.1 hypothetical protein [Antrihabitans stalagmiti]